MQGIINFCNKHSIVYCYGAGYYGKVTRIFLEKQGIIPKAFLVTHQPTQKEVLGLVVRKFSIHDIETCSGIIICTVKYKEEIKALLTSYGIKDYICIDEKTFIQMEHSLGYEKIYPSQKDILVLLYHRVCTLERDIRRMAITPEHFELQIKYIKENYPILRFEDDWSDANQKSIVITFDDGYDDFYEHALPILEKYGVPATLFVSSGILGGKNGLWTDELEQMIFETQKEKFLFDNVVYYLQNIEAKTISFFQIRSLLKSMPYEERKRTLRKIRDILEIAVHDDENYFFLSRDRLRRVAESPYVSIGGHTVTHSPLSSESAERQKFEISTCKHDLEEIIGRTITCFSYPYGGMKDYTKETVDIVAHCGYKKAATAVSGIASANTPVGQIPRCGIEAHTNDEFARQIRKLWTLYGNE